MHYCIKLKMKNMDHNNSSHTLLTLDPKVIYQKYGSLEVIMIPNKELHDLSDLCNSNSHLYTFIQYWPIKEKIKSVSTYVEISVISLEKVDNHWSIKCLLNIWKT